MKDKKARILHILLFTLAIGGFFIAYIHAGKTREKGEAFKLDSGWTVKYNDSLYEDVTLTEFRLPVTNKGDWIVMSTTLPENLPEHVTMRLHTIFTVTEVYLDGVSIFKFGMEEFQAGELLGYGTSFVVLPDECDNRNLMITMYVTEDNAFSSLSAPILHRSESVYGDYYGERILPLAVAVTLIVAGLAISIVTFCLYFKAYSMERLFCIGIFSACIGCWSMCNYSLTYIFTNSLQLKVFFEYLSLYLVPFPILLYFREDVEARNKRWENIYYYFLTFAEVFFYIIAVVCQIFNITHLPTFVRLFQSYMIIMGIFILHLIVADLRTVKSHRILTIGFAGILLLALRDLIVFNIDKYIARSGSESDYKSYVAAGALLLVVAMLVDFVNEMRKIMYKDAEHQFLEKIAYVDVLTDLFTRRKCDEMFEEIDKQTNPYTLIQFDLNNLKRTNDKYGHEEGDELIRRFARMLKETFSKGEILGRMGGDEFVVIIMNNEGYDIDGHLRTLEDYIVADNAEHGVVKVSVSYGYCSSTEFGSPAAARVYKEADKRMYKHKEEYYQRTGYKRRKYDNDQ